MEKARCNTELYSNLRGPLNNVKPSNFWGSHQPQIYIDSLISKGAKPLPLKEPTDTSIWAEDTNSWLERISGIKGATNGVYFYEPGHQEPHESEFLIYDRDSQTLYYRLMIM